MRVSVIWGHHSCLVKNQWPVQFSGQALGYNRPLYSCSEITKDLPQCFTLLWLVCAAWNIKECEAIYGYPFLAHALTYFSIVNINGAKSMVSALCTQQMYAGPLHARFMHSSNASQNASQNFVKWGKMEQTLSCFNLNSLSSPVPGIWWVLELELCKMKFSLILTFWECS